MSVDVERRLQDLFETIDRQAAAPSPGWAPGGVVTPLRRRPSPSRLVLAAAMVIVVVAVVVGLLAAGGDDGGTDVAAGPPATIGAAEFDARADEVCAAINQARNGIRPRFPTVEAYVVVADARSVAVGEAIAGLAAVPGPEDDPALPTRVIADLRVIRTDLDQLPAVARELGVEEAAARWAEVDPAIDGALAALADHGADRCRP